MKQSSPFQRSEEETPSLGITMAPLIDVVFLLLIFFMISTTFRVRPGLELNLPRSGGQTQVPSDRWVVSLNPEGEIYLNQEKTTLSSLESRIRANNRPVVVRADKTIPHGLVVSVLDRIRSAGVDTVDLSTQPLTPDEETAE